MHVRHILPLLAGLTLACDSSRDSAPAASPTVYVAAAADLSRAFEELGQRFTEKTRQPVAFSFGSTGLLAKQLQEGAPFDMFAAANRSFVNEVVAAGACDGATQAPYAQGRIAIWLKRADLPPHAGLKDLLDPRFVRIAIANPEHAPYGKAAKQALEKLGLWKALEPRIVYGENVRQALQFGESGNAEVAIVALSLVLGSHEGHFQLIDEALHAPIEQTLVGCKHGKNAAGGRAFATFVNGPEGRVVMRRYGFVLPSETLVQAP